MEEKAKNKVDAFISDLERTIKTVWTDEPAELARVRQGILETDAGTYGQWFSAFHDIHHELRWFAEHALPFLIQVSISPIFSLSHVKDLSRRLIAPRMDFLSWLGEKNFPDKALLFLAISSQIETREDLTRSLIALQKFAHRLYGWTTHYYPWGAAGLFPAQPEKEFDSLISLLEAHDKDTAE